jgi:hypothetical protein
LKYEPVTLEKTDTNATARLEIDLWVENNGQISVNATYRAKIYKQESIDRFMKLYIDSFEELVRD